MEINEQIKVAEELLKYTQDYISVKKLLKTVKTNSAQKELLNLSNELSSSIRNIEYIIILIYNFL